MDGLAKLVCNYNNTLVYDTHITIFRRGYKPTYHLVIQHSELENPL